MTIPSLPSGLPAQLRAIETELIDIRSRAHRLAAGLGNEEWRQRPEPGHWSIAEQIEHLNLSSRGYLPLIREAIDEAREHGITGPGPYRRDVIGWLLGRLAEPPVRLRTRTPAPFVPTIPTVARPAAEVLRDFDALQEELIECLYRAAGLALDRVDIASPYDPRVHYNLYSCLRLIPAHQRRHLWLGEQIRAGLALDGLEAAS
jgi:hypothetical protein